jgi:hypothetical protein
VSLYVLETKRLRSSSGHGVDWRTGVDFQHTGSCDSCTHITNLYTKIYIVCLLRIDEAKSNIKLINVVCLFIMNR